MYLAEKVDAFWPQILKLELSKINFSLMNVFHLGPSDLQNIAKRTQNKFWRDCFFAFANLSREAIFLYPNRFYLLSIFRNPLFKSARRALQRNVFGKLEHKIELVSDFYKSGGVRYKLDELNLLYDTNMTQIQLNRIHDAIQTGLASLNLNLCLCDWHPAPRQPIIVGIAMQNKKGCKVFL